MAAKKTNDSRFNILYLLLTLKKYSSATNPMSIAELTEKTNNEFFKPFGPDDGDNGINLTTVTRIMEALCLNISLDFQNTPMHNYKDINNCGFNVYCVMKTDNPEHPWEFYYSSDNKKGKKKYYYYESVFSDAELTALIDAIETYNYFSSKDISGIVSKLLGIRPASEYLKNYDEYLGKRLKDENSRVLANIGTCNQIIKENKFAVIKYCSYEYNEKDKNLQLKVRPKYPRIVRPLSMMWSNGNYYLIAQFKADYPPTNLRIDRISDIAPCTPTKEMLEEFKVDVPLESSIYRLNHPLMYGGELKHITFLYNSELTTGMNNSVMDTFGKLTNVRPASAQEIEKYIGAGETGGKWLCARVTAAESGVELFATQYCRHCRIISPESLATKVRNNLLEGLKLYQ